MAVPQKTGKVLQALAPWRWLVPLIYLGFGIAWILGGAFLHEARFGPTPGLWLEIGKGFLFVGLSALLLLGMLHYLHRRVQPLDPDNGMAVTVRLHPREQPQEEARLQRRVWIVLAILGLLIALLLGRGLYGIHRDTVDEAERSSRALVSIVAAQTAHGFTMTAQLMDRIARGIDTLDLRLTPIEADTPLPWPLATIAEHAPQIPGIEGFLVIDRNMQVAASWPPELTGLDVAERPYLRALREDPDPVSAARIRVSHPFLHVLTGEWIVGLSRSLIDTDGGFRGAVVAGLTARHIGETWEGLDLGLEGTLSLFMADGTMLMRSPYLPGEIGENFADSLRLETRFNGPGPHAVWETSPIDGRERLFAYTILPGWPDMILVLGRSRAEILAPVHRFALLVGSGLAGLSALALLFSGLYVMELRRRARARLAMENLARFPLENPNPVFRLNEDGTPSFANPGGKALLDSLPGGSDDHLWQDLARRASMDEGARQFIHHMDSRCFTVTVAPGAEGDAGLYLTDITALAERERRLSSITRALRTLVAADQVYPLAQDHADLLARLCPVLREAGDYALVWAGQLDPRTGAVTPLALDAAPDLQGYGSERVGRDAEASSGPVAEALAGGHVILQETRQGQEPGDPDPLPSRAFLPLRYGDTAEGILALYDWREDTFNEATRDTLTSLGNDIGFALRVLDSLTRYDALDRNYKNALDRTRKTLRQTIDVLSTTVEQRDPYTAGHQHQVSIFATAIGKAMDLPSHRLEALELGGLIHDIGKIGIPSDILTKPGQLSPEEHALVQRHVVIGTEIVRPVDFEAPIKQIIAQHHERLDGSGYPLGLQGSAISLEARIVGVADVFDAMTSHRPYRPARSESIARDELMAGRGSRYDADVMNAALTVLDRGEYTPPG